MAPCTPSTRALSDWGRLPEKAATASVNRDRTKTQSSMEPSWFAHVPVILYMNGLAVCEFCQTFRTEKSDVT